MSSNSTTPQADGGTSRNSAHGHLTLWIVIAIVLAIVIALMFPRFATWFDVGGQVFLRLLQMVVVPLVMASVMSGILGLGDIRKLGRPGGYALLFYLTTTLIAVATGLVVVNVINPGKNIDPKLVEDARKEGVKEVERAEESQRGQIVPITWDSGEASQSKQDGASDEIEAAPEGPRFLQVTIRQNGAAAVPATVTVLWRGEGETLNQLLWPSQDNQSRFAAGNEEGTYKAQVKLPAKARRLHVEFTAQQGGVSSVVKAELTRGPPSLGDIMKNLILMLFTENLLRSMVQMELLPLIIFSIVFAGMLTTMGRRSEVIANLVIGINDALMSFILLLMRVAPIGIFCLVAARFGKAQADGKFLELLQAQAYYILTVLIGLSIHAMVTLPLILWIFTRRNPYQFFSHMSQALLTAFSTASSTATLPVTMECAETKAGVSRRSVEFVIPLGATVNMDGTALYEAAAAIFIAQAVGFDLTTLSQLTIAITATLAAIGAAGIPEAGLVTMLIVLNAVGLPLELIGLILPVDWLLDRFRTAVNAFGDSIGSAVVERAFPD